VVTKPGWEIQFSADQKKKVYALVRQFAAEPTAPPTIKSCIEEIGEDLYNALVDTGKLVPVSDEVVFRWEDYLKMVEQVKNQIHTAGSISVAQARDQFNTSRRYVLAFLEHLDAIGMTVRAGDTRVLK
jgi:selenocysteine-specific elongation factor